MAPHSLAMVGLGALGALAALTLTKTKPASKPPARDLSSHAVLQQRDLSSLRLDYDNDHIMVYSMTKVGSTSLWVALGSKLEQWNYLEETNETYGSITKTHFPEVARDIVRKVPRDKTLWIFTSVRNPFARQVSAYFEDIEQKRHLANLTEEQIMAMPMDEMHQDFLKRWPKENFGADNWYSTEFAKIAGVDLTAHKFPFGEGRLIVEGWVHGRPTIVVLLRAEDVCCWWDIMRHHVPNWNPVHKEDARELWYGRKYEEFKKNFTWPRHIVEAVSRADSLRWYTIAERAKMLRKALGEHLDALRN
uniref:Sulfotransferase domain-containing protein n=1 Tax=Alexandrium monilatum TaxID=311494 RepID=A0A7S4QG48_9DINO